MTIEAASFIVLEDGTRAKKSGEQIYEGQPVALYSDGTVMAATATTPVFGLSKLDSNQYRDFSFGEFGAFGSGQLTVICSGTILLAQSVFNQIEINSSTTTSSAPVTVKIFDDTKTYAVDDPLYVDANGLISNDNTAGKQSLLGKVLRTPTQTGGYLEVEVNGMMPTTTAANLA